jgi:hypothetical protein
VAVADRAVPESWLEVDLGAAVPVSAVTIAWETAYGAEYSIQTSTDGSTWTTAVGVPDKHTVTGGWVNVDGRAGFVVRGSNNPLTVTANTVTLSDGPAGGATGMVVQAFPAQSPTATASAAAAPAPSGVPAGLAAAVTDGYLSLYNLTGTDLTGAVRLPAGELVVYQGKRIGEQHQVQVAAASAVVLPPRFTVRATNPSALTVVVADSQHIELTSAVGQGVTVAPVSDPRAARTVTLRPGTPISLVFPEIPFTPTTDLALGRATFPTSPLPAGMSDPTAAVDGDPRTTWRPGPGGRIVVDLGAAVPLGTLTLSWVGGRPRPAVVGVSSDGLTYQTVGTMVPGARNLTLGGTSRYIAVAVPDWRTGDAELSALNVTAG